MISLPEAVMEKIAKYYNVNADIIVSEYMNIVKADESLFSH